MNSEPVSPREPPVKRRILEADSLNKMVTVKKITGIGELHQYCIKNKIECPRYKIVETTDYSNVKLFTVKCNVKRLSEIAIGRTKKEAKHKAAFLLLERLKYRAVHGEIETSSESDEDSLEEGEICELEEGEIREYKDDKTNYINHSDDELDEELAQQIPLKYKTKSIYIEGINANAVYNTIDKNNSEVKKLAKFCCDQKLPLPKYTINEHVGLTAPIFTCQSSVLQITIRASGPTKETAKEKASKMLLAKMKKHAEILKESGDVVVKEDLEEGEIIDDVKPINKNKFLVRNFKRMKFNHNNGNYSTIHDIADLKGRQDLIPSHLDVVGMGDLYNYCLKLKIPPPIYTLIDKKDVSASKRLFTFQCSVLKFSKISYGLNKKQAKHKAARLVLEKLLNWNKEDLKPEPESDVLEEGEITDQDEIVKQEYMKHKMDCNFMTHEEKNMLQLENITKCHNVIKTNKPYTDSIIIQKLKELDDTFIEQHAFGLLKQICIELQATYSFIRFRTSQDNTYTSLYLNSVPPWSTVGEGENKKEAQLIAVIKLIEFFKNMT